MTVFLAIAGFLATLFAALCAAVFANWAGDMTESKDFRLAGSVGWIASVIVFVCLVAGAWFGGLS